MLHYAMHSGYAVPRARHQLMYTVKAAVVWTPANAWMWHDLVFESTVTRISGIGIMIHFPVLYINFVCFCYVMKENSQVSVDSWLRIYPGESTRRSRVDWELRIYTSKAIFWLNTFKGAHH